MHQNDLVNELKAAFLAGYYRDSPLGKKKVWELTSEEETKAKEIEAAAYEWGRARLSLLMVRATI